MGGSLAPTSRPGHPCNHLSRGRESPTCSSWGASRSQAAIAAALAVLRAAGRTACWRSKAKRGSARRVCWRTSPTIRRGLPRARGARLGVRGGPAVCALHGSARTGTWPSAGSRRRTPLRWPRSCPRWRACRRRPTATARTGHCGICSPAPRRRPLVLVLDDVHWADPASPRRPRGADQAPAVRAHAAGVGGARGPGSGRAGHRVRRRVAGCAAERDRGGRAFSSGFLGAVREWRAETRSTSSSSPAGPLFFFCAGFLILPTTVAAAVGGRFVALSADARRLLDAARPSRASVRARAGRRRWPSSPRRPGPSRPSTSCWPRALVRPTGGAAPVRVPPPGGAPRRVHRGAGRPAARRPRAGGRTSAGATRGGNRSSARTTSNTRPAPRGGRGQSRLRPAAHRDAGVRSRGPPRASTRRSCGCSRTNRTRTVSRQQSQLADALDRRRRPWGPRARRWSTRCIDAPQPGERLAARPSRWPTRTGGSAPTRMRGAGCRVALGDLPAHPSPDRIRLRLALGADRAQARATFDDALAADPATRATTPGRSASRSSRPRRSPVGRWRPLPALDPSAAARSRRPPAAFDRLDERAPDDQASRAVDARPRPPLPRARTTAAAADLERGDSLAAGTGRERISLIIALEAVTVLVALGRLAGARCRG